MGVDLLLCVATEAEGALLRQRFNGADSSIALVRMGVGAVNAAHAVTLFLSKTGANAIVVCGVGGAYPSSGLQSGTGRVRRNGVLRRSWRVESGRVSRHEGAGVPHCRSAESSL